jgi:aryl-alcohol dehydrogenase-like predicted oxidoreductase
MAMTSMPQFFQFRQLPSPVMRLGLATRGGTHLQRDDVFLALEQGVNYWNWCSQPDGLSEAVAELGSRRKDVAVAVQLEARGREGTRRELEDLLEHLKTDWLDVITFYYVESQEEWNEILAPEGAMKALQQAKREGLVRIIGLTTHQRPLASQILRSQTLDLLMIRYNAAHRGAETEIFPVAGRFQTPLVTFTALRWEALLKPTREDPPGFAPPPASEWYRFVLSQPAVAVALMAPDNRAELLKNLALLKDWRASTADELAALRDHGDRVRRNAGAFP